MISKTAIRESALGPCGLAWALLCLAGCQAESESSPQPFTSAVPLTIAVGPAMNLSGSTDFDPVVVGDIMASELTRFHGVRVAGVDRVLAMMAELGLRRLRSPEDAYELIDRLGVDGILVFAITEYDPYSPPVVGIAAQLYLTDDANGLAPFDPLSTSRSAVATADTAGGQVVGPAAEVQQVFDGADNHTAAELRSFAEARRADRSPYAWRKYMVSQRHFLRFCCSSVARDLLGQVQDVPMRMTDSRGDQRERMP
jgi:hypothetical protein